MLSNTASDIFDLGGAGIKIITKKDFSRLKSYVRSAGRGGQVFVMGVPLPQSNDVTKFYNYEVIPDNLNIGTYYINVNGEFFQKLTNVAEVKWQFQTGQNDHSIYVDYIKYVPDETYTIRPDEVWVQEVRAGGLTGATYSIKGVGDKNNDLRWEMIGFYSETRPATIRDLTVQTEKTANTIYVTLKNGLDVGIQPNTIHSLFYRTKFVEGMDSTCMGQLDKALYPQPDGSYKCESYVRETPIIQQCQTKANSPILPTS